MTGGKIKTGVYVTENVPRVFYIKLTYSLTYLLPYVPVKRKEEIELGSLSLVLRKERVTFSGLYYLSTEDRTNRNTKSRRPRESPKS